MATNPLGRCRYEQLEGFIGEGTYGKVEKAKDRITGEIVAIKKVRVSGGDIDRNSEDVIGNIGIHFTTIREIKIMNTIKHANIMGLTDVFVEGDFMNLVMLYMYTDLKKLIDSKIILSENHIKCIILQILRGLAVMHNYYFIHRDLSPGNVFIGEGGVCKVGDFGLSKMYGYVIKDNNKINVESKLVNINDRMTSKVVTLWYRPPELIYGSNKYGVAIDMWSVGCIFAELFNGKPLFPGTGEIDQLGKIFALRGTPSDSNWPEARSLPFYCEFTNREPQVLSHLLDGSSEAKDLIDKLLALNPNNRITATEALDHKYFTTFPLPCKPAELPLQYLKGG